MKLMEDTTQKLINSYSYDAMSRIVTVSDGTNTAEYTRLSGTNLLNSIVVKQGEATKLSTTKTYDAFNRLLSTSSVAGAATRTYTYEYNDKDQRTKLTLADGTYWEYTYDEKGQVTSGIKKDAAGNAIAGQSFNYTFDDIGNRKTATEGMTGMDSAYSSNNVNQYTQRTIPGAVPIAGSAATDATVRVKDADTGQVYHTTRSGKYFSKAVPVDNTSAAKEANLEIHAVKFDATEDKDIVKTISGKYYVAKTPQTYTYDNDGNMTSDGTWTYTYNAENRPVTVINADNTKKFEYKYDYAGRRIEEKYYTSTGTWTLSKHLKFVYKGFKKIAEYDGSDNLLKLYTWQPVDLDVPLWVKDGTNYYFYIVGGNKNVRSMVDVSGNEVASYDYKPFGGIASKSGTYADDNMYRFSSEYYNPVLKSSDYGLRDYGFNFGRWLTRDPIGERGGFNLYGMTGNSPINYWDHLGYYDTTMISNPNEPISQHSTKKILYNSYSESDKACGGRGACAELGAVDKVVFKIISNPYKSKGKKVKSCCLTIAKVIWHTIIRIPTRTAWNKAGQEGSAGRWKLNKGFKDWTNSEYYNNNIFHTYDGVMLHEQQHIKQYEKIGQKAIDIYNEEFTIKNCTDNSTIKETLELSDYVNHGSYIESEMFAQFTKWNRSKKSPIGRAEEEAVQVERQYYEKLYGKY